MVKHAMAEALGVSVFMLAAVLPFGCVPELATGQSDLQPLVAVAGAYSLAAPAPKPAPAQCENCGGRGVVGDGVVEVPCPACRPAAAKPEPQCGCGGKGYTLKNGTRWKCECKDCNCTSR